LSLNQQAINQQKARSSKQETAEEKDTLPFVNTRSTKREKPDGLLQFISLGQTINQLGIRILLEIKL